MEYTEPPSLKLANSPEFYIFTSYLWDSQGEPQCVPGHGNHYFWDHHCHRLRCTATALGWSDVLDFLNRSPRPVQLEDSVHAHLNDQHDAVRTWRKVKVCIYKGLRIHVESAILNPDDALNPFPWPKDLNCHHPVTHRSAIRLDTHPTIPSPFTRHKTSERSQYDRARRIAAIDDKPPSIAEVLLINPQNEIMECSSSTPYFFRNGRWVTPPLSSGGNAGVSRLLALSSGLCEEEVVHVDSLCDEEAIWISNGVRGFLPATLDLGKRH